MHHRPGRTAVLSIIAVFLLLPLTFSVQAQDAEATASPSFGAAGTPHFTQYDAPSDLPGSSGAGEPTIGIPWNTDDVFYMAGSSVYRIQFEEGADPTWDDVTPPNSILNVDPMLHGDPDLNRVWAGGLNGPCSIMSYTDDNGETWVPTGNMCSGAQFDHQSIGSGPYATLPGTPLFEHATYYCAQLLRTACATSLDGGVSWGPFNQVLGDCGGLHGHIRVSRTTGIAVVPHKSCGGEVGFGYTTDDGVTWNSRTNPDAPGDGQAFDPSIQFGRGEGWMWMGQAEDGGAFIGLSKDDGVSWEPLGGNQSNAMGEPVAATPWLDVGQFHDPPIVKANFADVQVGDDDRVAMSFLGLVDMDGDGAGDEYESIRQCDDGQEDMIWHYYVALSYDAGQTWTVEQMTTDPVQIGGIWFGQGGSCRNLLDFNDMDIDSTGRIYIPFADGCTRECAETEEPDTDGYRTRYAALLRQETGLGLFSEFDGDTDDQDGVAADPDGAGSEEAPALGVLMLIAALVGLSARRRY